MITQRACRTCALGTRAHWWPPVIPAPAQDLICHRGWTFPFAEPFSARYSGVASHLLGPIERYGRVPFCGLLCEEGAEDSSGLVPRPSRFTSAGGGFLPTVADGVGVEGWSSGGVVCAECAVRPRPSSGAFE